ncbi:GntR family transcriptional regulator [Salinibacterium soli]|uniref:GntR family transcriptional regulator n=1 Tax=Antiquaquibacter soli TaxID=3064523 RepID=A0ABT9BPX2_9MICO|nr:GntR family transcriptional regulator [Protaetiibacter sp. WY-16]MDO7883054.1 GntR family transcriptional regulator [Protaetiibacter sp. WY-16]
MSDTTVPDAGTDPRISSSPVVTKVFDDILAAVNRGDLLPGQRISDAELAQRFGVSRTPVREALQRLRDIGVIEASASRFTRVADVTPQQTLQAYIVWQALFTAVLEEVVPGFVPEQVESLRAAHEDFLAGLADHSAQHMATANFLFVQHIAEHSRNAVLQRALVSVVHIIRLGSLHLPEYVDVESISRAQSLLITACESRDLGVALEAMRVLRSIRIPQN